MGEPGDRRGAPRTALLVSGIGVVLVVLAVYVVWARVASPSDGTVVQLSNRPWDGDRLRLSLVLDPGDGLRVGDEVVEIDGRPVASLAGSGPRPGGELRPGDRFTYTVVRDGAQRHVAVELEAFQLDVFVARNLGAMVFLISLLAIAAFVFHNRPSDPAAQALLLVAAFAACGVMGWLLGAQAVGLAFAGLSLADFVGELALALAWGAVVHFTLVAPGTHLLASRTAAWVAYSLPLALHAVFLAVSLPAADSRLEAAGRLVQVSLLPSMLLPLVIAVLMVMGYRSTRDRASRRRLRWVLFTVVLAAAAWLLLGTLPGLFGRSLLSENLILLVFLPCPLALGAAILRYRLFDIEVILRRSLLYGSLTACVVLLYVGTTWLLSRAIGPRPGLIALLGTGLVALSVSPLRRYLQRRVGRLIYGERDDPYTVISRLSHIDAAAAPRTVLSGVVETLAQTLRLPYAAIELHSPDGEPVMTVPYGRLRGQPWEVALTHGGIPVGRLLLDVGPGREPFGPADQRLLDTLERQVSRAASTVLLTAELQRSREKLAMTREEERRRLRHRLHDGLAADLAAALMQLEIAKYQLHQDPDGAEECIDELIGTTRDLIEEVRGLVYNLRPPSLDQLGLARAIRERATYLAQPSERAARALQVQVDCEGSLASLPAAVEVAAFWIVAEAVRNAVRHASASSCTVRLTRDDDDLRLEIRDDGRGLPDDVVPGDGLLAMRERAQELGGSFVVERHRNRGTVVRARLPILQLEAAP